TYQPDPAPRIQQFDAIFDFRRMRGRGPACPLGRPARRKGQRAGATSQPNSDPEDLSARTPVLIEQEPLSQPLLPPLRLLPVPVHLFQADPPFGPSAVALLHTRFDVLEAAGELVRRAFERALGVHADLARQVDDCEKEIPELLLDAGRVALGDGVVEL